MRWFRILLVVLLAMLIVVAGGYLLRKPIAGLVIRQAMAAQGLANPQARVTALSINQMRIENVSGAEPGHRDAPLLRLDQIELDYAWRDLLTERRVEAVRLGPGWVRIEISENGAVRVAGIEGRARGEGAGKGLPFDRIIVSDLEAELRTPEGIAAGSVAALYDGAKGGEASASFRTQRAGLKGVITEGAHADASFVFAGDGTVDGRLEFTGDVQSPYGQIRDAEIRTSAAGSSWKEIVAGNWRAFNGTADIEIGDATIETQNAPAFTALNSRAELMGDRIDEIAVSGDLSVMAQDGEILITPDTRPLAFVADNGASLSIDTAVGEPLFAFSGANAKLAGVVSFRREDISIAATVSAQQSEAGWRFTVPVRIGAFETPSLALLESSAIVRGEYASGVAQFEATATGAIKAATVGRLTVSDTPVTATVGGSVDLDAKKAVLNLPTDNCAMLDRVSVKIARQDMDASLRDARLCSSGAPLALLDFAADPVADFSGLVTARQGRYRLGQTRFAGTPPSIELAGRYLPADNITRAQGTAKGGSVVMNELLRFDRLDAALDIALEKENLIIGIDAGRLRMTEYGENDAKVAPIFANGSMRLADNVARFNYNALSAGGDALGAGSGEHNVKTASGAASFTFNRLSFAPGGMQPDELAPVLKGIFGLLRGAAEGGAEFSWSPDGINSGARMLFDDVTFNGPGLTVTQTIGVNGEVAFSSLWPVATAGAQTVTVAGVDFGALQLHDGEIVFDMPGDDTLLVERAVFPWFGGEIGVRDATATFTGGNGRAPLQAAAVDLQQILEFVDVQGLSGAGTLNGVLPIHVENSRASIVGGRLTAEGPGHISYVGQAGAAAAQAGGDAQIAFDILRDLRYEKLSVLIDGPLDGRLDFRIYFEGTGNVSINRAQGRVPVKYTITLDAALLELLNQANLSRNLEMQIKQAVQSEEP